MLFVSVHIVMNTLLFLRWIKSLVGKRKNEQQTQQISSSIKFSSYMKTVRQVKGLNNILNFGKVQFIFLKVCLDDR